MKKTICVTGAGGFIGSAMVKKLKSEGHWVRGVDLKYPDFSDSPADEFIIADLTDPRVASQIMFAPNQSSISDKENSFDQVYAYASWMGGAGVIFSGSFDADILRNSLMVDINTAHYASKMNVKKVFFSGSACCYNADLQTDPNNEGLKESFDYPANPDSDYGWGKLTSERVYQAYNRNYGLDIRICRFHNIFGEESCYNNNKEKFPAAVVRKVIEAPENSSIEIWGDGLQTRSFLYIEEALEGVSRLMESSYNKPVNIGSSEMISINDLAKIVIEISGKNLTIKNVESNALGVRGRNSDNTLIQEVLGWQPIKPLREGMEKLYSWVSSQINK
jgi:GDP-D-mannose 3', 5'-epimerase